MDNRKEYETLLLNFYEDVTRIYSDYQNELNKLESKYPSYERMLYLIRRIESERKTIEELSSPCRLILEHFSFLVNKEKNQICFALGKFQRGKASITDFQVKKFGNIVLYFGDFYIQWRDADYKYNFYPDKIIMTPIERDRPEISFDFSLSLKHSRLLDVFPEAATHPQTSYWHENLDS